MPQHCQQNIIIAANLYQFNAETQISHYCRVSEIRFVLFNFVLQCWKITEDYSLKMSYWFANEVLWIKLVCLDWVYPCGTCVVFCVQGLNMLLYLWNYIPPRCAFLTPCLIIRATGERYKFADICLPKLEFARVWGNICRLCLPTFLFLIVLLPCIPPITAVEPLA